MSTGRAVHTMDTPAGIGVEDMRPESAVPPFELRGLGRLRLLGPATTKTGVAAVCAGKTHTVVAPPIARHQMTSRRSGAGSGGCGGRFYMPWAVCRHPLHIPPSEAFRPLRLGRAERLPVEAMNNGHW